MQLKSVANQTATSIIIDALTNSTAILSDAPLLKQKQRKPNIFPDFGDYNYGDYDASRFLLDVEPPSSSSSSSSSSDRRDTSKSSAAAASSSSSFYAQFMGLAQAEYDGGKLENSSAIFVDDYSASSNVTTSEFSLRAALFGQLSTPLIYLLLMFGVYAIMIFIIFISALYSHRKRVGYNYDEFSDDLGSDDPDDASRDRDMKKKHSIEYCLDENENKNENDESYANNSNNNNNNDDDNRFHVRKANNRKNKEEQINEKLNRIKKHEKKPQNKRRRKQFRRVEDFDDDDDESEEETLASKMAANRRKSYTWKRVDDNDTLSSSSSSPSPVSLSMDDTDYDGERAGEIVDADRSVKKNKKKKNKIRRDVIEVNDSSIGSHRKYNKYSRVKEDEEGEGERRMKVLEKSPTKPAVSFMERLFGLMHKGFRPVNTEDDDGDDDDADDNKKCSASPPATTNISNNCSVLDPKSLFNDLKF